MKRIFYLIPDVFNKKFSTRVFLSALKSGKGMQYLRSVKSGKPYPVGGIKVHYQHVALLRELGFDANCIQMGEHSGNFFSNDIEPIPIAKIKGQLEKTDVIVATEYMPYEGLAFNLCHKIMFVQNWANIQARLQAEDANTSYRELGYDTVISCGEYTSDFIRLLHNEECQTITNGIDPKIFYSDPSLRVNNRIMCLPRKNPADLNAIKKIVKREHPSAEFVDVHGVSEKEIAVEYRKSDIFLATGYPEGFSLPPLEAIFSGCVVTGFAGRGGREFLSHEKNSLVAEDGDYITAAKNLCFLLSSSEIKEQYRSSNEEVVSKYCIDQTKLQLQRFYGDLMQIKRTAG